MYSVKKTTAKRAQLIDFPVIDDKRAMFALADNLDMARTECEVRNASFRMRDYANSLCMHKVYTVHEFWPV